MWNKIICTLLTLAALALVGPAAWGDPLVRARVGIYGRTYGSVYAYVVSSSAGPTYQRGPTSGTYKNFDSRSSDSQFTIGSNGDTGDITMTLDGRLNFANATSATDVTSDGVFTITFISTDYYLTDAAVTTRAGAAVEGCTVSDRYTKTITITIPTNTTFGEINIDIATHTPLNYCTLGGLDESYVDYGEVCPEPVVTLENKTLIKNLDYTLSYTQGASTGSVTVTGAGDYVGSKFQRYDIREPALSDLHSLGTDIYEIATQQDLDFLARIVKGKIGTPGNDCVGKTFRQTADIAYSSTVAWDYTGISSSDSNFTPVGVYGSSFCGTYDGQGHTISGIRVCKHGTGGDDGSLGLFGYLGNGGTVKNIVLRDANIEGFVDIGGIVGYSTDTGTVTDCYLYNVRVCSTFKNAYRNLVVGNQGGTVTRTYFRDCCEYAIMGTGQSYNNYKTVVFTVTTDANVTLPTRTGGIVISPSMTMYDDGLTLDGTQYYTEGTTLTLTYSGTVHQGEAISFSTTGGTLDGLTLTMPAADVEVTAGIETFTTETITARQVSFAGQTRYWTTFYNPNFNCQLPAGAQAFTMKDDYALYRVGDGSIIPANCAVVIIADTAELTLTSTDSSATPEYGNILKGVSADTEASTLLTPVVPGSNIYLTAVYVLSRDSDGNFGFFKFSGTIPAGKAYYVGENEWWTGIN